MGLGKIKDDKIGVCFFCTKHKVLLRKSKNGLPLSKNNMQCCLRERPFNLKGGGGGVMFFF